MEYVITFIVSFLLVYILYLLLSVLRRKEYNPHKVTVEQRYIIYRYKLNMANIKYRMFSNMVALVTSLSIAVAITVSGIFEASYLQMISGFIVLIPLLLVLYHILGKIYQKKGSR